MEKNFLVTISNDADILYGVRFVCSFFDEISDHKITLLHICRRDDLGMEETLSKMWQGPNNGVKGQLTTKAKRSIDRAIELLSHHKMSIDNIMTKTSAERYGKVRDILTEGTKGHYDAIVLGRRASYSLQWMFERPADETAGEIIRDSCCITPIWICPEPLPDLKNVLVCIDGSENSFRAVDHVGFILASQEHQNVTLFYVDTGGSSKTADIFSKGVAILDEHGISSERIGRDTGRGVTVVGTILREIEKGGYAAVAVGFHGEGAGFAKSLNLAGGTTVKLISRVKNTSLWCCP